MADDRIILTIDHIFNGQTAGIGPTGGQKIEQIPMAGQNPIPRAASGNNMTAVLGSISANLLVSGGAQILAASGNTELATTISQGASYAFLAGRIAASGGTDITAILTLMMRGTAQVIKLVREYKMKQEEIAKKLNALDVLKMRSGMIVITANTQMSYNKYGRLTTTDRR